MNIFAYIPFIFVLLPPSGLENVIEHCIQYFPDIEFVAFCSDWSKLFSTFFILWKTFVKGNSSQLDGYNYKTRKHLQPED